MRTFSRVVPALGLVGVAENGGMSMLQKNYGKVKVHGIWTGYKSSSPLHVYVSLHICDYPYE